MELFTRSNISGTKEGNIILAKLTPIASDNFTGEVTKIEVWIMEKDMLKHKGIP